MQIDINVPRTLVTLVMSKWYDNNLQNNNRDVNAAKNILNEGLRLLAS